MGWPCGSFTGCPYSSRSRLRIASTRLRDGRRHSGSRLRMRGGLPGGRVAVLPSASTIFEGSGMSPLNVRCAPTVPAIETDIAMVDGVSTFFRRVPGDGPPVVFVHGNPTHSEDWMPFLERMRGPALALDLPGWGRSARPSPSEFDYSMHGLGRFVGRFLEQQAVDRYSLVVHDWGTVGLFP